MTVSTGSGGSGGGSGSGSGGGSGCYIATMAYGDYDHPQVMILRRFRDEVLVKTTFGQWFIKTYYYYSPKLVERLKKQRTVNIIIRKALNQFIKLIK
jgi:predicted amino acid dehydrogenase